MFLKNLICKETEDFKITFCQKYLLYFYNFSFKKWHISELINLIHYGYFKDFHFLSKKENECLYFAGQGKTFTETANILNVRYETVREYRKCSFKKMNARNITEATVKFYEYENRSS